MGFIGCFVFRKTDVTVYSEQFKGIQPVVLRKQLKHFSAEILNLFFYIFKRFLLLVKPFSFVVLLQ